MTLDFISKHPVIKRWLIKQVGYYSNELYQFSDNKLIKSSINSPKLIIIAKCHYSESWQSFPSVNKKEIEKILELKNKNNIEQLNTSQVLKNSSIDGYDVKTVTINTLILDVLGHDKIFIPESDLFILKDGNKLLEVDTLAGRIFCAKIDNKIKTSYAKGIINNISNYKLTVGIADDTEVQSVGKEQFPEFLLTQFQNFKLTKLHKVALFKLNSMFNSMHLHLSLIHI